MSRSSSTRPRDGNAELRCGSARGSARSDRGSQSKLRRRGANHGGTDATVPPQRGTADDTAHASTDRPRSFWQRLFGCMGASSVKPEGARAHALHAHEQQAVVPTPATVQQAQHGTAARQHGTALRQHGAAAVTVAAAVEGVTVHHTEEPPVPMNALMSSGGRRPQRMLSGRRAKAEASTSQPPAPIPPELNPLYDVNILARIIALLPHPDTVFTVSKAFRDAAREVTKTLTIYRPTCGVSHVAKYMGLRELSLTPFALSWDCANLAPLAKLPQLRVLEIRFGSPNSASSAGPPSSTEMQSSILHLGALSALSRLSALHIGGPRSPLQFASTQLISVRDPVPAATTELARCLAKLPHLKELSLGLRRVNYNPILEAIGARAKLQSLQLFWECFTGVGPPGQQMVSLLEIFRDLRHVRFASYHREARGFIAKHFAAVNARLPKLEGCLHFYVNASWGDSVIRYLPEHVAGSVHSMSCTVIAPDTTDARDGPGTMRFPSSLTALTSLQLCGPDPFLDSVSGVHTHVVNASILDLLRNNIQLTTLALSLSEPNPDMLVSALSACSQLTALNLHLSATAGELFFTMPCLPKLAQLKLVNLSQQHLSQVVVTTHAMNNSYRLQVVLPQLPSLQSFSAYACVLQAANPEGVKYHLRNLSLVDTCAEKSAPITIDITLVEVLVIRGRPNHVHLCISSPTGRCVHPQRVTLHQAGYRRTRTLLPALQNVKHLKLRRVPLDLQPSSQEWIALRDMWNLRSLHLEELARDAAAAHLFVSHMQEKYQAWPMARALTVIDPEPVQQRSNNDDLQRILRSGV